MRTPHNPSYPGACKQLLAAIRKSTAETIRHTFTSEGGLVYRIRHCVGDYLARCAHVIRKVGYTQNMLIKSFYYSDPSTDYTIKNQDVGI